MNPVTKIIVDSLFTSPLNHQAFRLQLTVELEKKYGISTIHAYSPIIARRMVGFAILGLSPIHVLRACIAEHVPHTLARAKADRTVASDIRAISALIRNHGHKGISWFIEASNDYMLSHYQPEEAELEAWAVKAQLDKLETDALIGMQYFDKCLTHKTIVVEFGETRYGRMIKASKSIGGNMHLIVTYLVALYGEKKVVEALGHYCQNYTFCNGEAALPKKERKNPETICAALIRICDYNGTDFKKLGRELMSHFEAAYVKEQNAPKVKIPRSFCRS